MLNQSLKELEIIVVNDGSTDDSQKVIDKYYKKYPGRIVTLLKENEGLGFARNDGIRIAKGDFIGFVDSDDWVHPQMFKSLYKMAAKGHDFIICDYVEIFQDRVRYVHKGCTIPSFNHRQAVMHSTEAAFACNKLIKKSLFNTHLFTSNWYEDLGTIPILLANASSPTYVKAPLYYYRKRAGSITKSDDIKTLGVIHSWERVLALKSQKYRQEIVFAVAKSIATFLKFKPKYKAQFMEFAEKHRETFAQNKYYREAVSSGKLNDLFAESI